MKIDEENRLKAMEAQQEEIARQKDAITNLTLENQTISKDKEGLITRNKELIEDNVKKEELRAKWYSLYQQSQTNLESCQKDRTTFQKQLTECQNQKDLTWGELIIKIWNKIRGVKI